MKLSIAIGRYDRTQPLFDGRVRIEGFDASFESPPLNRLFARAFDEGAWDVAELSCSNFVFLSAERRCRYVGLPVFPSRMFRHSAIYIAQGRGIEKPEDLVGRVVGTREYSMTASLVARGVLRDEYGLRPEQMRWLCGPLDAADARPVIRVRPPGVDLQEIPVGSNLTSLLLDGSIDALVAHRPPRAFTDGDPRIGRLFADPRAMEQASHASNGVFPIMHLLGIRRELAEDAALCLAVCAAFEEARRLAFSELESHDALPLALPWVEAALGEARAALGKNYWSYGMAANRKALDTIARYSHEQGISSRLLSAEELIAPVTHHWIP